MPVCGSGGLVCSSCLLIRRAQRARCQAETPPILLSRFPEPALFRFTGRPVQSAIFISPRNKKIACVLYPTHNENDGEIAMPTPKEYRLRADECLELTNETDQWYVKTALLQLAAEFQKRAERLERSTQRS